VLLTANKEQRANKNSVNFCGQAHRIVLSSTIGFTAGENMDADETPGGTRGGTAWTF